MLESRQEKLSLSVLTMNSDITEILQQGLRIVLGGASILSETVQDPQKRTQTLEELQVQLKQKAQELAQKGEITEREVLTLVEQWLQRDNASSTVVTTSAARTSAKEGLEDLTSTIIALRKELEDSRAGMV
jgi:hypothetical protein